MSNQFKKYFKNRLKSEVDNTVVSEGRIGDWIRQSEPNPMQKKWVAMAKKAIITGTSEEFEKVASQIKSEMEHLENNPPQQGAKDNYNVPPLFNSGISNTR
jgi:hypothetical protein